MTAVLFVCLGNICRSPLAEGVLRRRAAEAGWSLAVDSAGTGDWHAGHPPDRRAQAVAQAAGFSIADQRARQVTAADFQRFTHIVAMDAANLAALQAIAPADASAWLGRLLDFAPDSDSRDVPDPYYGGPADFERTLALIEQGVAGLIARVRGG